jgi:serine/threonine protein kinase
MERAMNDSTPAKQCPRCGATLPADTPEGLCPRCLAAMHFGPETELTGEARSAPLPPLSPEELAPHFPQLEILQCLGRGGMGVVYKTRQKSLNRFAALKLLAPERAKDGEFAKRFTREAHALAALNHPHIVTVYDFGQAGGFYFLLMEFVDGVTLRQAMNAKRFTPKQALAVVPPVCEALQYAHDHGIVHRDIKPENLLLDKEGRVKIADFGIAKIMGDDSSTGLAESQPAGTPQYMAPEQKDHQYADHRADIYSLGVVLYEMLTGELPGSKLQPPSRRVAVDVRIDEIVLRALEQKPEMRYATATEFRTEVEAATAKPTGRIADLKAQPAWPWKNLFVALCAMVILSIIAAALLLASVFFLSRSRSTARAEESLARARAAEAGARDRLLRGSAVAAANQAPAVEFVIRKFGPDDPLISKDVQWEKGLDGVPELVIDRGEYAHMEDEMEQLRKDHDQSDPQVRALDQKMRGHVHIMGRSIRLYEWPNPGVENCTLLFRAKLQTYRMTGSGTVEMGIQARLPTGEERMASGRESLSGSNHWVSCQASLRLEKGEKPDLIRLSFYVTNGEGDLRMRDIELHAIPNPPEPPASTEPAMAPPSPANTAAPPSLTVPDSAAAQELSQEGWGLWQKGQPDSAYLKFMEAVRVAPEDANAWNGVGWTRFNVGKSHEAEAAFQKVISLDPNHAGALNGLGQIYLSRREYDKAEPFLLQAAQQKASAAWFGLARLYLLQGKFEDAEKWAQMVVDSGQGGETATKMLEAAKNKLLTDGLRQMIEPPLPPDGARVLEAPPK